MPRRVPPAAALTAAIALSLLSARAVAQPAPDSAPPRSAAPRDTFPARAGTWAVEGGLGLNTTSVGALRFVGPRSALSLNLTAYYDWESSAEIAGSPTQVLNAGRRSVSTQATLGFRRYARLRSAFAAFGGLGATAGTTQYRSGGFDTRRTGVGGYAELGAGYLAARRLAVNVSTQLAAQRFRTRQDVTYAAPNGTPAGGVATSNGWSAQAGGTRVSVTLFF